MKPAKHALGLCLVLASCGTGTPLAIGLAACAGPPVPRIETKVVDVPVPVHCHPAIGPEPAYPDTAAAVRAAPDLFHRVQLLLEGRLMRIQRDIEKSAALTACE